MNSKNANDEINCNGVGLHNTNNYQTNLSNNDNNNNSNTNNIKIGNLRGLGSVNDNVQNGHLVQNSNINKNHHFERIPLQQTQLDGEGALQGSFQGDMIGCGLGSNFDVCFEIYPAFHNIFLIVLNFCIFYHLFFVV